MGRGCHCLFLDIVPLFCSYAQVLGTTHSLMIILVCVAVAGGRASHRANDDAANLTAMHALQRKAEKKKEKKKRKKEKRKNNTDNKFTPNNGKM